MRRYKAGGRTVRETADRFGIRYSTAKEICRGLPNVGNQYTHNFDRIANAKRYISERTPAFEYAGNFTGIDGEVDLKCKACGCVITRAFVSVRQGKVRCPNCYDKTRAAARMQRAHEHKRRRDIDKGQQIAHRYFSSYAGTRQPQERHCCVVCGSITTRRKYCGDRCKRKAHDASRYAKMKAAVIDRDITLEALFKRDRGLCYICGMQCLYDDYIVKNGTVVCGDWYPSIDHVEPLSRGGRHAWDNVRLAHRRCNYMKSDRVPPPKN